MKYDRVIGIDPGVKTGIAMWIPAIKIFDEIKTVSIIEAFDIILKMVDKGYRLQIRFEDCRLRKWKGLRGREALKGVGSIERDCKVWQEFCEYHEIDFMPIAPQTIKTKMSADQFERWSGWKKRTSEHARDAAMIVLGI